MKLHSRFARIIEDNRRKIECDSIFVSAREIDAVSRAKVEKVLFGEYLCANCDVFSK